MVSSSRRPGVGVAPASLPLKRVGVFGSSGIFRSLIPVGRGRIVLGESKDRIKQKHYQAWQVINSAQGKGGSSGRIDALEELHQDGVLLVGVDVSDAFLQGSI